MSFVKPLLSVAPFRKEEYMNATSHVAFIEATSRIYRKTSSSVIFLVANNEPLNKRIAKDMRIRMIGCARHRFYLKSLWK